MLQCNVASNDTLTTWTATEGMPKQRRAKERAAPKPKQKRACVCCVYNHPVALILAMLQKPAPASWRISGASILASLDRPRGILLFSRWNTRGSCQPLFTNILRYTSAQIQVNMLAVEKPSSGDTGFSLRVEWEIATLHVAGGFDYRIASVIS